MSDKLPDIGSDGTKIKEVVKESSGIEISGELSSVISQLTDRIEFFSKLTHDEMRNFAQHMLDQKIITPKIKSKSEEIQEKILKRNENHYKFIKDSEKKKERLEKDKARSLKELGDGDSATRKLIEIQEKNPIARIFKTGMFDFKKGISDSIKSTPLLSEFGFVKDIADSINPEMQSEKDIERLVELGKEIESYETAITRAGGQNTEEGSKLAEKLKEFKSEESQILARTGDPLEQAADLEKIEFEKLSREIVAQKNVLEEINDAIRQETARGESADKNLIDELKDRAQSEKEQLKKLNKAFSEIGDKSQTEDQEALIAAAKAKAAGSDSASIIKAANVTPKEDNSKSGNSFMMLGGGKGGLLGWAKSIGGYFLGSIFSILGMKSIWASILKKGFIPYMKQFLSVMLKKSLKKGLLKPIANLLKFIPRLAGFLISGVIWAVSDAIKGMTKFKGLSGFLGGLIGGMDKGLMGSLKGAGKWALIGAGVGSIFPVVGTAAGGIIGAIFGAIMGWIGGERISKAFKSIGEWFSKKWKSLSKWWENSEIKKTFDNFIKDLSEGMEFIAKKLGFGKEFKKLKKWFNEKLMTGKWFEDLKKDLGVVWGDIKIAFKEIWKNVSVWFGTKWETFKKDLELVWGDIKKSFTGVFSEEGTIGKWWAELKTDLGVIWEDIKQNKLVKSITEFFGWFAELFSWENVKGMLKKMAKGAGVPDTFTDFVLSGLSRKAEPPKKLEPVKQLDNTDSNQVRSNLVKMVTPDENGEIFETPKSVKRYISDSSLSQSEKDKLIKEFVPKITASTLRLNSSEPIGGVKSLDRLSTSEQTKKDIDNKVKSDQGKGDIRQNNTTFGGDQQINIQNTSSQQIPIKSVW